jgi:hypothetical protein
MLGIMTLKTKCCYSECRVSLFGMLSVVMLSVVTKNVVMLDVMAPLNVQFSDGFSIG